MAAAAPATKPPILLSIEVFLRFKPSISFAWASIAEFFAEIVSSLAAMVVRRASFSVLLVMLSSVSVAVN